MSAMSAVERLEAVLMEHDVSRVLTAQNRDTWECDCGWFGTGRAHFAHVAAALREAGYVHRDQVKAEALREAGDEWTQGRWADAPRRVDRVQERIATAQHVGDWLRDRAEHLGGER
ncbi:MAG: hypothetical protein ACR2JO_07995 [Mycobacteriales bacterium]